MSLDNLAEDMEQKLMRFLYPRGRIPGYDQIHVRYVFGRAAVAAK